MAAMRERHQERRQPVPVLGLRVDPVPDVEVIDLGFFARRRIIEAHGHPRRWSQALWPVLASIAIETGPADPEVLFIAQSLVEHTQTHRTNTFGEMLVVLGDR